MVTVTRICTRTRARRTITYRHFAPGGPGWSVTDRAGRRRPANRRRRDGERFGQLHHYVHDGGPEQVDQGNAVSGALAGGRLQVTRSWA